MVDEIEEELRDVPSNSLKIALHYKEVGKSLYVEVLNNAEIRLVKRMEFVCISNLIST